MSSVDVEKLEIMNQTVYFKTSEKIAEIKEEDKATLVVTSPPYWNLKDYGHPGQIGKESYDKYLERMNVVWEQCYEASKENAILAINVGNRRYQKKYYPIAMDIYNQMKRWKLIDNIIWYIPNALPQANYYINHLFDNKYENVLIFAKNWKYDYTFNKIRVVQKYRNKDHRKDKYNPKGRCIGNVIRIPAYRPPNVKSMNYHVAAYPEELVYFLISAYTNLGDVVLDPFLGSGTTLKVSRILNRRGIGYEINQELKNLIKSKITEDWIPPDFSKLDVIMSTNPKPTNNNKPRKPKINKKSTGHNWF